MPSTTSRSRFLREALRAFDTRDVGILYELAANDRFDTSDDEVEELSSDDNQVLFEMEAIMRETRGELLNNRRLSVGGKPKPNMAKVIVEHMKLLSPGGRARMLDAYRKVLSQEVPYDKRAGDAADVDALDARYAHILVGLLPDVVTKSSSLQTLDVKRIPKASVQRYFDEAHRCYFFGLSRACVALCRAILEAALKEVIGPNHRTNELIEMAGRLGRDGKPRLDAERLDAAERIISAGDSALHREPFFDRNYSDDDVEHFLLNTRKILEDLYSQSNAASV